jgi:hypothetical protein
MSETSVPGLGTGAAQVRRRATAPRCDHPDDVLAVWVVAPAFLDGHAAAGAHDQAALNPHRQ